MKYNFKLENLDCINCAQKLEKHLSKDKNLSNVKINFSTTTLTFESNINNIKKYISKKIKEIEPDIKITEKNETINKEEIYINITKLIIAIILIILSIYTKTRIISQIAIIISYIILLSKTFTKALKLLKRKTINENFLITLSCIGAYFTNNVFEGLMVIILYNIGQILEHLAVNNSRQSIAELMNIKPEYANLKKDNNIIKVKPEEVYIGDIIIVKKGEKVPLDGTIIKGCSLINNSALTGESKLKRISLNETILSGTINISNILEIKVTKLYEDSTISRILDLVQNASNRKAKTENFVSVASKIYTPIVLTLAILIIILFPLIFNFSLNESIYRALSFLVISCPCAIAISVPLSYFSGLGAASKQGILIKGSDYLSNLKNINKIIFDKTGTITTGNFDNFNLIILNNKYKEKEIIEYFIKGESFSNHPIAKSILKKFNKKVETKDVKNFKEITGKGLSYNIDDKNIIIGSSSLVKSKNKDNSVYLKIDNEIIAKLELTDSIKENIKETIEYLNNQGIKTLMFTGDSKDTAKKISASCGIQEVKCELLPEEKYKLLEQEMVNSKVAFVGDGINDAPSIARADIGISMGSIGSASAIEASDIVIANDNISKIIEAINISKMTDKIIKQNLIFAITTKILVLILSAIGISSMWQAVFADTGVTLLTIINTTRILKTKKIEK